MADTTDMIRRVAERRRNAEAILRSTDGDSRRAHSLLANAGELTRGLDPAGAGDVLYRLGQHYVRSGDWALAADVFHRVADQYPDHPLTDAALVWLVQYYSSAEGRGGGFTAEIGSARRVVWSVAAGQNVQEKSRPAIDANQEDDRLAHAAAIGKQIEATRPELFAEPAVRFPLAVASRRRGFPADAGSLLLDQENESHPRRLVGLRPR